MILDTSYLVALQQGVPGAVRLARDHESNGVPQRIPSTVLSELYVSVGASADANENVRKYEELIGNLPIVDIDENIARRAGALRGESLTSDSDPVLGLGDATVAAIGLVFNEPVVTEDIDDFDPVAGLDIVSWDD
ncbi:PIN domain-containing protein [Halosimplex pelagicum]|uniref:PIN domain-containing protein n=1 Tax=Halosimplex pelagicum TaxID=869886 RepID=A0A7D5P9G6_9EURY|nr:PIN domain-containing protein [Halosimplex pelagicum]QLH81085.1 PIN domain-containing protein [Halosimplex pelagicum]